MPPRTRKQKQSTKSNAQPQTQTPSTNSTTRRNKRTRNSEEDVSIDSPEPTIESTPLLDKNTTPTLENYEALLQYWPPGRLHQHLQSNKGSTVNRAPPAVQDQVKLLHNRFKQEILMMAMIGGVSESTIKSYL